ncbi:hypothetical protein M6B38_177160 [Iris pallida]|uniref:Uncharacterized protein n=1 Tax=Iris pallida TaxID=29817 RepID=A0AAX6EP91_IRIPA|nr:hypothetical protein M6B38_177160 [Iris pallida]
MSDLDLHRRPLCSAKIYWMAASLPPMCPRGVRTQDHNHLTTMSDRCSARDAERTITLSRLDTHLPRRHHPEPFHDCRHRSSSLPEPFTDASLSPDLNDNSSS